MAKVRILIDMPISSDQLLDSYSEAGFKYEQLQQVQFILAELASGMAEGRMNLQIGDENGDSAAGTVTISGSGAQSVTINGQALAGGTAYAIANLSASEVAANLAEAIRNSSGSRVQAVLAEASGAVVTLTAKEAGLVGNAITTTATGAAAASGATLSGGTEPSQRIYLFNRKA